MLKKQIFACAFILAALCPVSYSQNKKKQLIVHAGASTRQVTNHPWSYTTPGQGSTDCSTYGTVNGTGTTVGNTTDINGTVSANTNCNSTYTPPKTTSGNIVTVNNASWVTDINLGDQYLIECTAHWRGSKCSYLNDGDYKATLEGNSIWIKGNKGMKEMTAKYTVLQFRPASRSSATVVSAASSLPTFVVPSTSRLWTEDEKFVWGFYNSLPDDDKKYVEDFCTANPNEKALLPHAKVLAGQPSDRTIGCSYWLSAKAKL